MISGEMGAHQCISPHLHDTSPSPAHTNININDLKLNIVSFYIALHVKFYYDFKVKYKQQFHDNTSSAVGM